MKPIVPPDELPANIRPVLFQAPEGTEDEVNNLPGLVHLNENNEPFACEFLFELSKEEIQVLRHEPYLTITMMVQAPPVFSIQSTYSPDEKYEKLLEHSHVCTENLIHENQRWWQCDNPAHDGKTHKLRTCDKCFQVANEEAIAQVLEEQEKEAEVEPEG